MTGGLKRVPVEHLRRGMFVVDLGCDWLSHPFLRSRFEIRSENEIVTIRDAGIREVTIDTRRGRDEEPSDDWNDPRDSMPLPPAARSAPSEPLKVEAAVSIWEELPRAKELYEQSKSVVRKVMAEARLGSQLATAQLEPVVQQIAGSVLRNHGALLSLARLKSADNYTFEHSVSVCALTIAFFHSVGHTQSDIHSAALGALLHDIGKMRTPIKILNKLGPLTAAEFEVIKRHPEDGQEILSAQTSLGNSASIIALQHHERVNATGYPHGLAGEDIAPAAQMVAVADVYDAITSQRLYRKSISPTEAMRHLFERAKDGQFDLGVVSAFIRCIGIYPTGSLVRLKTGKLAFVSEQNEGNALQPKVRIVYDIARRGRIGPRDVDLAVPEDACGESIVGPENPAAWGLENYLPSRTDS